MKFSEDRLSNFAKIRNGMILTRYDKDKMNSDRKTYKILSSRYIEGDGSIAYNEVEKKPLDDIRGSAMSYIAMENDIIMKLSRPFDAAVFHKPQNEGDDVLYIIPSFSAIIRIDEDKKDSINPEYIVAYLNSSTCKENMNRVIGEIGNTFAISASSIGEITLPIPDIETQNKIADEFIRNREHIRILEKIRCDIIESNDAIFREMK